MVEGAPLQVDVSGNFMFYDKFMLGVAYRWSASMSAMAGFQVTDGLYIGYGYDKETTNLDNYNSGSHEIFCVMNYSTTFKKSQLLDSSKNNYYEKFYTPLHNIISVFHLTVMPKKHSSLLPTRIQQLLPTSMPLKHMKG